MVELLGVILGFALSVLSIRYVSEFKRRQELMESNKAILTELDELRYLLAFTRFKTQEKLQCVNNAFLTWVEEIVKKYRGPNRLPIFESGITKLKKFTDEQLRLGFQLTELEGSQSFFKKISTPAINANLHQLGGFPSDYQNHLFTALRNIEVINQEIDRSDWLYKMTFDSSLDDINRSIIDQNFQLNYEGIDRWCDLAIKSINELDKFIGYRFRKSIWL